MARLDELTVFARIVEESGITSASRKLGRSKSVVSRQLAALERRLGTQLIVRTTRQLVLTERGRSFYERVRQSLVELAEAEAEVSDAGGEIGGRLRIAAPLSFGRLHLTPALHAFLDRHPGVDVDLDLSDRQVDIVASGFDLAVRIARLPDSSLIARRLCGIEILIAASPAYWRRHGRPREPADLARHRCLHQSGSSEQAVWSFVDRTGRPGAVRFIPHLSANDGEVLVEAAVAGHGVICEPGFIMHETLADGRLEPALTDWTWSDVSLNIVYPPLKHLPRKTRAMIDHLAEWFGRAHHRWEGWRARKASGGARLP
jgi:DNA-binding transcriptional LysR family regulator